MEKHEVKDVADQAAESAVHRTFSMFGVDTRDQNSLNDFRADLIHARKMRRTWDAAAGRMTLGVILAMLVAGIVFASDYIKGLIR